MITEGIGRSGAWKVGMGDFRVGRNAVQKKNPEAVTGVAMDMNMRNNYNVCTVRGSGKRAAAG